ncbi:hypothetical protein [Arthrobacter sp. A5]|uniref:hypothetical protein n=1 Tax=Arthrobacter sp. A5 TaxID=576926 RepID=UPI003DA7B52B
MQDDSFVAKFMRTTGKLRAIFGPANSSSLDHEMTEDNKRLLAQQQVDALQWETARRPDGSTYLVPRDGNGQSLR